MAENFQMLGNAALMERPKVAFLSSRKVAPAVVMRIEHDYEFTKRQGPDLSPALHRIAEAQRSVNNPSWGSVGSVSKSLLWHKWQNQDFATSWRIGLISHDIKYRIGDKRTTFFLL